MTIILDMENAQDVKFDYEIETEDGNKAHFEFVLDGTSLYLKDQKDAHPPDWAKLDNNKCSHCPLNSADTPYCPIAKNIAPVIEAFKDLKSFVQVDTTVRTEERTYSKKASLQEVLASMMGIPMATSGCPHMNFLRVMARFHLPFSSFEETYVRTTSFFLLKQYLRVKEGKAKEISMAELEKNYENIKEVNLGIVERIRSLGKGDADPNAIVMLHSLADIVQRMVVDTESVNHLQKVLVADN